MTVPSYHDLHITAPGIPRTSIFNLPYGLEVSCTRVTGWQLWQHPENSVRDDARMIAGEYDGPDHWLILDVGGHVIVDSTRAYHERESEIMRGLPLRWRWWLKLTGQWS